MNMWMAFGKSQIFLLEDPSLRDTWGALGVKQVLKERTPCTTLVGGSQPFLRDVVISKEAR
jgi:hypothetical protein